MSPEIAVPVISNRLLQFFVEAAREQVGAETLPLVLDEVELSPSVIAAESTGQLDPHRAAEIYALVQQALRLYYGRGARGILMRVGQTLWQKICAGASLAEKLELQIVRRLPVPARRRRVLEFLAGSLRQAGGQASVHQLDIDLLLMDRSSAATCGQRAEAPVCYVSLGLVQGALQWATGREADVEEISCRAAGAVACEFKVKLGGG